MNGKTSVRFISAVVFLTGGEFFFSMWPSCIVKTYVGYYEQTFQHFFIPVILIDTIDFCHFTPFPVTLTLGQKVSAKQNLLSSFSHTFLLIRMKFCFVLKQFKLNIMLLLRLNEARK